MNRVRKVLAVLLCMAMVVSINCVYADTGVSSAVDPNYNGGTITGITDLADRIWATTILIVQVVSVGCVVFAGLRYMYASADKKADIKKGMMYLAIGAIFVYATSTVMKFVFNIGSGLIK